MMINPPSFLKLYPAASGPLSPTGAQSGRGQTIFGLRLMVLQLTIVGYNEKDIFIIA